MNRFAAHARSAAARFLRRRLLLQLLFASITPALAAAAPSENTASATGPIVTVESRSIGTGPVLSGLDVLKRENFARLKGKRIGLLTNHTAIDRDGHHLLDLVFKHPDVNVVSTFAPEHGLFGNVDTKVSDFVETRTQLHVYSLYTDRKDPETKPHYPRLRDLRGLDAVLIDMQDIGARFYTYSAYMAYMLEQCGKLGIEAIVLDRPNPIGGLYVDGPITDPDLQGGVTTYFAMPIAHGMTMGEMARMFNEEKKLGCRLTVVPVENWKRGMFFDQTGLRWTNPSPNIQDLDAAIAYPGVAIPENQISMGRGTAEPFHVFGAPWLDDPKALVDALTTSALPGVRVEVADFTPTGTLSRYHPGEGKLCRGARFTITDRTAFRPVAFGIYLMHHLNQRYGDRLVPQRKLEPALKRSIPTGRMVPQFDLRPLRGPAASWVVLALDEGKSAAAVLSEIDEQVTSFKAVRSRYLMYPE